MNMLTALAFCSCLLVQQASASDETKGAKLQLPRELEGIELGMSREAFFAIRPDVESRTVSHQIADGVLPLDSTDFPRIDLALTDDIYSQKPSRTSGTRFRTLDFIFISKKLVAIQLDMRLIAGGAEPFYAAREELIRNCFELWGKEHSRKILELPKYPWYLSVGLEWIRDGVTIRLIVAPRYDETPPANGQQVFPHGELEILSTGAVGYKYVEAKLARKEKKQLLKLVGIDRIWREVKRSERLGVGAGQRQ